jgi:hypothetical protein
MPEENDVLDKRPVQAVQWRMYRIQKLGTYYLTGK